MAKHTSSSSSNINDSSRLVKLNILEKLPSTIALLPHIKSPNQIVELHLFGCDKEISVNFLNLSPRTLTDSLNSLNSLTNIINIQFIQFILHCRYVRFGNDGWTVLRTVSTLL